MNLRTLGKIGATGLALLPLLGSTCMEDKIVDLILTFSAEAEFMARGDLNTHSDTSTFDLKAEVDVPGILAENDIDPATLDPDKLKLSKIFYKVTMPQAGRMITGGTLHVRRDGVTGDEILVDDFSASMAAATDWIEITGFLGDNGVAMINDFLEECVRELNGTGPPVTNSSFTYTVSGTSTPVDQDSNFDWAVKVQLQGKVPKTLNLPNI